MDVGILGESWLKAWVYLLQRIQDKRILKMKDTLNQILSERTGQPLERILYLA